MEVNKKLHRKPYDPEFRRSAVEMVLHSGKSQTQVAKELGVSDYSLSLWKREYLLRMPNVKVDGQQEMTPQQMAQELRRLQKENEYLKRQREILKKAVSILGEEPTVSMR